MLLACLRDQQTVVELLLRQEADPNVRDKVSFREKLFVDPWISSYNVVFFILFPIYTSTVRKYVHAYGS